MDAHLEPNRPDGPDFEPEVAQQTADVVLDRKGLLLQELTGGEQSPALLT